ncbi:hypothetical protein GPOL_c47700 [Gordonia polyisoprenivorans VH2]|uniref:Uncharacterized protein n=1 Tax=Gordonia polyisoprenivorans (strain DSM 44266 / VH2) TaxID=1112204 RepID=H6N0B1_GORPV|nr:hypothetical protein GPOL_c47700 [Gordonia polyisoprenivorans VH2]
MFKFIGARYRTPLRRSRITFTIAVVIVAVAVGVPFIPGVELGTFPHGFPESASSSPRSATSANRREP